MSTRNPNNLAPVPNVPERGRTTYQVDVSDARPGRVGPVGFEEGLANDPEVPRSFMGGIVDGYVTPPGQKNHNAVIETKIADGRGVQGRTNPAPSWAAVDQAMMDGFIQGNGLTEQVSTVSPPPFRLRGSVNRSALSPRASLLFGERPNTVYQYAVAPTNGGRHRNEAEVD